MKKITLFMIAGIFAGVQIKAQVTVQSEDFTTYLGTAVTMPAGWTFSYNGNYTSTASSGTSGPNSYKFGANGATITSPFFTLADSLSFWIKGNTTDTLSTLFVLESADNINWDTIASIKPLPTNTTGQSLSHAVAPTSHYIGFSYFKSLGNVAFDDYRLYLTGPTSVSSHNNASLINISPNPGTGLFMLNRDEISPALVSVYDVTGKKIMEKIISGKQSLDLTSEPNGCYFVTVRTEKELITKKIIINK